MFGLSLLPGQCSKARMRTLRFVRGEKIIDVWRRVSQRCGLLWVCLRVVEKSQERDEFSCPEAGAGKKKRCSLLLDSNSSFPFSFLVLSHLSTACGWINLSSSKETDASRWKASEWWRAGASLGARSEFYICKGLRVRVEDMIGRRCKPWQFRAYR